MSPRVASALPARPAAWALLSLRLGLAAICLPYGLVRLFTFPVRVEYFASLYFPAPALITALNMTLEITAGLLLVLGLRMRLAAALVMFDTLAILTPVNWTASPLDWWPQIAVRVAPAVALALLGPGAFHVGRSPDLGTRTESA
ncbi:MAG: DoxX family protein [Gammaproteobacteria bacterium]